MQNDERETDITCTSFLQLTILISSPEHLEENKESSEGIAWIWSPDFAIPP